jgi:hypothetical protein
MDTLAGANEVWYGLVCPFVFALIWMSRGEIEICPPCGIQFGYIDCAEVTLKRERISGRTGGKRLDVNGIGRSSSKPPAP